MRVPGRGIWCGGTLSITPRLRSGTGEIIAWGTCSWFRPAQAVRMWLNSSGHRALLMRPGFRVIGTGWNRGPWRGYSCVEMAVARFR